MARLEADAGRTFGRGAKPLLVSVRSGAAMSMPGMMDTLLNCGPTPALAAEVGDTPAFWQLYLEFVRMFAKTVHGLDAAALAEALPHRGGQLGQPHNAARPRHSRRPPGRLPQAHRRALPHRPVGRPRPVPINAVFESWRERAGHRLRKRNEHPRAERHGRHRADDVPLEVSGIVFTQDPNDLRAERMIIEASYGLGESVVSGDVTPDRFLVSRKRPRRQGRDRQREHGPTSALGGRRPSTQRRQPRPRAGAGAGELRAESPTALWPPVGHRVRLGGRAVRAAPVAANPRAGDRPGHGAGREEEISACVRWPTSGGDVGGFHNLAETLRAPTPMTSEHHAAECMGGAAALGGWHGDLGYRPCRTHPPRGYLELICGEPTPTPNAWPTCLGSHADSLYDVRAVVRDLVAHRAALRGSNPNRADGRGFLAGPARHAVAVIPVRPAGQRTVPRPMKRLRRSPAALPADAASSGNGDLPR